MGADDFFKNSSSYKPDDPDYIHYLKAEKVWDQRDGTVRQANANLRLLLVFSLVANLALTSGIVYQGTKSTMVPYVVEVSGDGHAQAVGLAKQATYDPKEKEIQYFIERFIQDIRTIPMDPVVAKKQWNNASLLLRPAARNRLQEEFKKENMAGRLGVETTQLEMKSNIQQAPNTYQVRWIEEVYNKDGALKERYNMIGSFTFEFGEIKDEKEWRITPLGLYIKGFAWSREL